jgi:hypothetical protein
MEETGLNWTGGSLFGAPSGLIIASGKTHAIVTEIGRPSYTEARRSLEWRLERSGNALEDRCEEVDKSRRR